MKIVIDLDELTAKEDTELFHFLDCTNIPYERNEFDPEDSESETLAMVHTSKGLVSLFLQIDSEAEYIHAVSNQIPRNTARLLWYTLSDVSEHTGASSLPQL